MRRITFALSLVFLFIVPWEDSISAWGLGSLARIMGFVVAAMWVTMIFVEGRFRKPHLFHFLVLLFFLWNAASVYWSLDPSATLQRIITYGQIFLALLVFWEVFQKPSQLTAGLQAYLFGEYVLVAGTIYSYLNGIVAVAYEDRYSAPGVNANDLALSLILGLVVATYLFLSQGRGKWNVVLKIINLAYIPLAIFAIVLTGTRTSLLAVIPLPFYVAISPQIKWQQKISLAVAFLIVLLALLPFIPQAVLARLGTTGSSIAGEDLGGRVGIWREAIMVLAGRPLLGSGSATLISLIGGAAHNTFLSVAAETGLIGFTLFLSILVITFYQALRLPIKKSAVWIAIFMCWAIGAFTLSWEFRKLTWVLLSLMVIAGNLLPEAEPEKVVVPSSKEIRPAPAMHEHKIKSRVVG